MEQPQLTADIAANLAAIASGGQRTADPQKTMRLATQQLNTRLLAKSSCVPALVQLLVHGAVGDGDNDAVRQLAAVELRKRAPKFWKKVPAGEKQQIRQALLALLSSGGIE